jgi:hypothetical protein
VAGASGTHLLVCGVLRGSTLIASGSREHSWQLPEDSLCPPKTPHAKRNDLHPTRERTGHDRTVDEVDAADSFGVGSPGRGSISSGRVCWFSLEHTTTTYHPPDLFLTKSWRVPVPRVSGKALGPCTQHPDGTRYKILLRTRTKLGGFCSRSSLSEPLPGPGFRCIRNAENGEPNASHPLILQVPRGRADRDRSAPSDLASSDFLHRPSRGRCRGTRQRGLL